MRVAERPNYSIRYDATGLIDGGAFAAWYAVVDAETGEAICRCDVAGRGEGAEADAESRAIAIRDLFNRTESGAGQ